MSCIFTCNELILVVDNNVLIDLYELGRLDILFMVSTKVIIPRYIYEEEVQIEIKELIKNNNYILEDITREEGLYLFNELTNDTKFKKLSIGDRIAISIAHENIYFCTSNDGLVRKACATYKVKISGTLGIIGRAYLKGFIDKPTAIQLSRDLESTSCFMKKTLIDDFISDKLQ